MNTQKWLVDKLAGHPDGILASSFVDRYAAIRQARGYSDGPDHVPVSIDPNQPDGNEIRTALATAIAQGHVELVPDPKGGSEPWLRLPTRSEAA